MPNVQETLAGMARGFYPEFIATPEISHIGVFIFYSYISEYFSYALEYSTLVI